MTTVVENGSHEPTNDRVPIAVEARASAFYCRGLRPWAKPGDLVERLTRNCGGM